MEKLCVFCDHLKYNEAGTGDYADPADLECKKGHGLHPARESRGQFVYDIADFRAMILTASHCPDYAPPNAKVQRDSGGLIAGGSAGTTGCASKVAE